MIAQVAAVIVYLSAAVQLAYCLFFFRRALILPPPAKGGPFHRALLPDPPVLPVSVIICARNEAKNLRHCLPFVLEQHYHDAQGRPLFEVIVVNDQSEDDSPEVLESFRKDYPALKIVHLPAGAARTMPGKKFALSAGVAAAQYDHLLMTDADCVPATEAWIAWMAQPFADGREIVAGYGAYNRRPGLLNRFVRLETLHTFLQYYTYNLAGHPYMAVGRNLACRRDLLLRAQQDPLWTATTSGDDDLLIRLCATADNMAVNRHPGSWTWSDAKPAWGEWVRQKQRHLSTGKLYRPGVQALLGGYALSHALFWTGLAAALIAGARPGLLLIAFLARVVWWVILAELSDTMDNRRLKWSWPLFDIGWLAYNLIFAPFIFWKNKRQWK